MHEVRMPQKGLTETSAYLSKWYVNAGDRVKTGDYLFAMETSKSVFDIEAETDGTVLAVLYPEGEEVDVEAVVCVIGSEGESYDGPQAAPAAEPPAPAVPVSAAPAENAVPAAPVPEAEPVLSAPVPEEAPVRREGERIAISPRAKARAEELGFDYSGLTPTGPEGRIIEEDIIRGYREKKEEEERAVFSAWAVETKIFSFNAEALFAYEETLARFPQGGGAFRTVNDMILYAASKTAAKHPEMMRGMPVFFAGSGAPYYTPALDPAAGWSLGVGAPKKEFAVTPDGSEKKVRTITLAFVYSTAMFSREAIDAFAEELTDALEHFPVFLAARS